MFTGSPDFDDEGEEHVPEEPVRYVGKPTNEVDAAWDKLTEGKPASNFSRFIASEVRYLEVYTNRPLISYIFKGRYFLLSEKEAFETWGNEAVTHWDDDWGGYLVG